MRFPYVRRKISITPESNTVDSQTPPRTASLLQLLPVRRGSATAIQVLPEVSTAIKPHSTRIKAHELADVLYYWTTCLFIVALVCSQLLGAVWDSLTTTSHLYYGRTPQLGPSQIIGTNDVPYPDRVIACLRIGHFYEPRLVSSLLAAPGSTAILEDSTGTAVHGYRLRKRRVGSISDELDEVTRVVMVSSCALIAKTIDNIFDACSALGYSNLTRDHLRVVDDWDSDDLYLLPNTLPILIMPYYDNTPYSRHAIPTFGGDACVFRLEDAYALEENAFTIASFRGVNQSVRHERTVDWLKQPGGVWRNGWYEDTQGIRWYSDVLSSAPGPPFYMHHRSFDMRNGVEMDCFKPEDCEAVARLGQWGDKFISSDKGHAFSAVYVANGSEYGLFLYEGDEIHTVRTIFDWETLVSNLSVGLVLIRWVLALVSLHSGAYRGRSLWFSGGIGCVSGAGSFRYLPIASLPRLKMTLAVFWTVGCRFEGQQAGLAESWFVMYPGIANFVLIFFSLLNFAAKTLRRRISDALFTPTVVFLCLLHYFRLEIAESGWLKGVDGRIATVVFSEEAAKLHLADFFTSDLAWRINGRVKPLFGLKLALLGINLLPLVIARPFPIRKPKTALGVHGVEKALAIRAKYVGGLGCSLTYMVAKVDRKEHCVSYMSFTGKLVPTMTEKNIFLDAGDLRTEGGRSKSTSVAMSAPPLGSVPHSYSATDIKELKPTRQHSKPHEIALVNSYELIRLGYLVFGDKYLITFDEWDLLSSMAPFRSFCHFWNHRVLVWTLRPVVAYGDAEIAGGRALQSTQPQMWRLDDARLQRVRWWQVSACGIQC